MVSFREVLAPCGMRKTISHFVPGCLGADAQTKGWIQDAAENEAGLAGEQVNPGLQVSRSSRRSQ